MKFTHTHEVFVNCCIEEYYIGHTFIECTFSGCYLEVCEASFINCSFVDCHIAVDASFENCIFSKTVHPVLS